MLRDLQHTVSLHVYETVAPRCLRVPPPVLVQRRRREAVGTNFVESFARVLPIAFVVVDDGKDWVLVVGVGIDVHPHAVSFCMTCKNKSDFVTVSVTRDDDMLRSRIKRTRCEDDSSEAEEVTSSGCCVYFYATVSASNILKLVNCLREATECAQKHTHMETQARVYLYLHTNGGDAYAGLSGMDHIRMNPVPITTIVDGMVASAGSFLLLGAETRKCMPNSFVRIHQVSISGFEGKFVDFVDEFQNTNTLMDTMRNVYLSNTSMSKKRLEEILKKEIDMNAQTCVDEGLVHSIVSMKA